MDLYQNIIHKSRYSRFLEDKNRREAWEETVGRSISYLQDKTSDRVAGCFDEQPDFEALRSAVLNLDTMPSMRLVMTAGEAVELENIAAFNCAYLAVNTKRSFAEALYILMCGTGIGFSCERQEIAHLPTIPNTIEKVDDTIVVADSKKGWAIAFKKLLSFLWEGELPKVDYSRVREAGARLKTFGGRASGPEPLKRLFKFVTNIFKKASGRKLTSIEVHDIMCVIGDVVVVGGVRRSALISLSNLSDNRMRNAKTGEWWVDNPQRRLANNSAVYTEKPEIEIFMEEWLSLIKSKSGERGIFSRIAAQKQAAKWGRRSPDLNYATNPCSEIILRDKEFCNLTEVVVREGDTLEDLKRKVENATILGTIQSTLTDFGFLSEEWKKNTEEERLLGVSLTGIMDHSVLNGSEDCFDDDYIVKNDIGREVYELPGKSLEDYLEELRDHAREVNEKWAKILGIPASAAITCVKPSGTVSQLVNSASGIHARHAPYYIRRIRMDKKDPIYSFLKDNGVPVEDDVYAKDTTAVFSFPIKAPEGAVCRDDRTAIQQLELWLIYQRHWCEHKPSITISVKEHEWLEVGAWVYKHFDEVSGISFLPHSDHTYQQAPYEDITEEEYNTLVENMPKNIDWDKLVEEEDLTEGVQELACTAGGCEI